MYFPFWLRFGEPEDFILNEEEDQPGTTSVHGASETQDSIKKGGRMRMQNTLLLKFKLDSVWSYRCCKSPDKLTADRNCSRRGLWLGVRKSLPQEGWSAEQGAQGASASSLLDCPFF